jgi:hypothetical protein
MELFEQHALHSTMNLSVHASILGPGIPKETNKQTHKAAKQNQKKKKITYISQTPTQRSDIRSSSQGSGSDLLISDFELKFLPQTSMCLSDYPERISKEQIEGRAEKGATN